MKLPDDPNPQETLGRIVGAVRRGPIERDLVCPDCGGRIDLRDGVYFCVGGVAYQTLAELQAVDR